MKLEDLPESVLARILTGDTSWAAVELWKCGSPSLCSKLSVGGVQKLSLVDGQSFGVGRWPGCLHRFTLTELSLHSKRSLGDLVQVQVELSKLQSSLQSLEVSFVRALEAVFPRSKDSDASDEEALRSDPKRRKIADNGLDTLGSPASWSIGTTLPALEHLRIGGASSASRVLKEPELAQLPSSLLSLAVEDPASRCSVEVAALSRTLTKLALAPREITKFTLKSLPTSLTDINACLEDAAVELLAENPSILPKLKNFPHSGQFYHDDNLLQLGDHNNDGKWPATIKNVTFDCITGPPIDKLPSGLTSLTMADCSTTITSEWLTSECPQSLQALDVIESFEWDEIDHKLSWPPGLASLSYVVGGDYGDLSSLCRLPRFESFKQLTIKSVLRIADVARNIVPLNDLTIQGRSALGDNWTSVQQRLLQSGLETYSAAIENGGCLGLPLQLTELSLIGCIFDRRLELILPPCLEKLRLSDYTFIQKKNFLALLPPSLTDLSVLGLPEGLEDELEKWEMLSEEDPSATDLYKATSLLRLELHFFVTESVEALLPYLPRSLRHLIIECPKSPLSDEGLKSLPTHLETLELLRTSIEPEYAWASSLPRSLKEFKTDAKLHGADLENLPTTLEILSSKFSDLTVDHVLGAPSSLRRLEAVAVANTGIDGALTANDCFALREAYCPLWRMWHAESSEEILANIQRTTSLMKSS